MLNIFWEMLKDFISNYVKLYSAVDPVSGQSYFTIIFFGRQAILISDTITWLPIALQCKKNLCCSVQSHDYPLWYTTHNHMITYCAAVHNHMITSCTVYNHMITYCAAVYSHMITSGAVYNHMITYCTTVYNHMITCAAVHNHMITYCAAVHNHMITYCAAVYNHMITYCVAVYNHMITCAAVYNHMITYSDTQCTITWLPIDAKNFIKPSLSIDCVHRRKIITKPSVRWL